MVEKVKVGVQEFFNLPMEEKKKLWQLLGDVEGFAQAFVVFEEQKLDYMLKHKNYLDPQIKNYGSIDFTLTYTKYGIE